jgi:hypothetical protein
MPSINALSTALLACAGSAVATQFTLADTYDHTNFFQKFTFTDVRLLMTLVATLPAVKHIPLTDNIGSRHQLWIRDLPEPGQCSVTRLGQDHQRQ